MHELAGKKKIRYASLSGERVLVKAIPALAFIFQSAKTHYVLNSLQLQGAKPLSTDTSL
ncbi:Hypothetical protein FKW44_008573 [Caligus rogercresseyi]|uniref:Uncharacterized protein n=1 Tax=Caligus rogercresseyi TaxID=217165 RepID=A0A7T8KGE3_CALRO|nr:Hypothetical protein FKW44_008573 [Caligus rogercresseyi]